MVTVGDLIDACNEDPTDEGRLCVLNDWLLERGEEPWAALPRLHVDLWVKLHAQRAEKFTLTPDQALKKMKIDRTGMRGAVTTELDQEPRFVEGMIRAGLLKRGSKHYDQYLKSATVYPDQTVGQLKKIESGAHLLFLDNKGYERLGELGFVKSHGGGWRKRIGNEPIHGRLSVTDAMYAYGGRRHHCPSCGEESPAGKLYCSMEHERGFIERHYDYMSPQQLEQLFRSKRRQVNSWFCTKKLG